MHWVLLATGVIAVGIFMKSTSFDRAAMEAVVTQVRSAAPPPGETREYWLEGQTLCPYDNKARPSRGQGAGHAGEYSFAYSDIELTPAPLDSGWFTLDVPGHLNLVQSDSRIDARWWKVVHNLD